MKRKRFIILAILLILVLLFIAVVTYYYQTSQDLTVNTYTLEAPISSPIRIVHLTDLHNTEYGENNSDLISLIESESPDLILMTGDMINRDDEKIDIICNLITNLNDIAPIYFGYGNHESSWEENYSISLIESFTDAGAIVVNNNYVDITINEANLRIGGYMGYYRQPGMLTKDIEQKQMELAFADDFENTDRYKILLNHIPTQWVDWNYIDEFPVNLVFSGHYHGGMIRIPLIDRGIYAPYVGLFPKHTKGVYIGSKAVCILSAGLGSEHFVPRLNNPPEIVVVDLVPYSE